MSYKQLILISLIMFSCAGIQAMDLSIPDNRAPEEFVIKTASYPESSVFTCAREQVSEDAFVNAELHNITLTTESGIEVPVLHIDRKSDTVIILGQGLSDPKEIMLPTAALFSDYDVILFDYRWSTNFDTYQFKAIATCSFITKMFHNEAEEIRAVLSHIKDKEYTNVVGLGLCYSAILFAKVQSEYTDSNGSFTHLVLDSCMTTLESMGHCLAADPYLMDKAHEGGAPAWLRTVTGSRVMRALISSGFMCAQDLEVTKDLKNCSCPILFIHGKKDYMVPESEFEKLWNAAPSELRTEVLTPFYHAHNLANRKAYGLVIKEFIKKGSLEGLLSLQDTDS